MTSVKRHADGRHWRARWRCSQATCNGGACKGHEKLFDRKVDAQRHVREIDASIVVGTYVDPRAGRESFRDYAERWRAAAPHSPGMRDKVERTMRLHAYPAFGDQAVSAVLPSTIQAWVTGLPLSPEATTVALAHVRSVFRAAVRDRKLASNPCDGVKVPAGRRSEVWIPELDAIGVLASALPGRYRAVADLVVGSGLRQGEAMGLEVDHIDFLRGRALVVKQQLVTLTGPAYLGPPKSQASYRTVPLAPLTLEAIASHLAEFPPTEVEIEDRTEPRRPHVRPARLIFQSARGAAVTRGTWSTAWRPPAKSAGFPARVGLHALRHFYASLLIRHGESVKTVQKRMGHASAAITLDTYGHLWPDADDRTREAVSAGIEGPVGRSWAAGT